MLEITRPSKKVVIINNKESLSSRDLNKLKMYIKYNLKLNIVEDMDSIVIENEIIENEKIHKLIMFLKDSQNQFKLDEIIESEYISFLQKQEDIDLSIKKIKK